MSLKNGRKSKPRNLKSRRDKVSSAFRFFAKSLTGPKPKRPLKMGGYSEAEGLDLLSHLLSTSAMEWGDHHHSRYLKGKAELDRALARASGSGPAIQDFAAMLKLTGGIPDKLMQAKIVNAWVNLRIAYNVKWATTGKADYRSPLQALHEGAGGCVEQADLKLFALEKLDFDPDDIRWVCEKYFYKEKEAPYGHALIIARIAGKTWALNTRTPSLDEGEISNVDARCETMRASRLEPAATALNFSRNSFIDEPDRYYVPVYSFNSQRAAYYQSRDPNKDWSNVPKEVMNAPAEIEALKYTDIDRFDIMAVMKPALASRYSLLDKEEDYCELIERYRRQGVLPTDEKPLLRPPAP